MTSKALNLFLQPHMSPSADHKIKCNFKRFPLWLHFSPADAASIFFYTVHVNDSTAARAKLEHTQAKNSYGTPVVTKPLIKSNTKPITTSSQQKTAGIQNAEQVLCPLEARRSEVAGKDPEQETSSSILGTQIQPHKQNAAGVNTFIHLNQYADLYSSSKA